MLVKGVIILATDGSSSLATTPSTIQAGLKEYWAPVYSAKACEEDKAKKFIDLYAKRCGHLFEFASLEELVIEDYTAAIRHCKHSACGEDGIPYSAYKATSLSSPPRSSSTPPMILPLPRPLLTSLLLISSLCGLPLRESLTLTVLLYIGLPTT